MLLRVPNVLECRAGARAATPARCGRGRLGRRARHGRAPGGAGQAQPAARRGRADRARARRDRARGAGAPSAVPERRAARLHLPADVQPLRGRRWHAFRPPRRRRGAAAARDRREIAHRHLAQRCSSRRRRTTTAASCTFTTRTARTASSCRRATWCSIRRPACTDVTPVTRGARIASFFWVQSLVRDDAQRALLFDLDMAIVRLTPDAPGHARWWPSPGPITTCFACGPGLETVRHKSLRGFWVQVHLWLGLTMGEVRVILGISG